MLRIASIEEIEGLLLQLPALVQQYEQSSADFVPNSHTWLLTLEKVLLANRLHHAGTVAGFRGDLVAAQQGHMPANLSFRGQPSRSRVLRVVAVHAIQSAANVVSAITAENRPRISEAEQIAAQLMAIAVEHGLVFPRDGKMSNIQYLLMLRDNFVRAGNLETPVLRLEGLVGPYDALILMDRALTPFMEMRKSYIPADTQSKDQSKEKH